MATRFFALLAAGLCATLIAHASPARTPSTRAAADTVEALTMVVGEKEFGIVLRDNATARALRERLPLVVSMEELNGNEKFYRFSDPLPASERAVDRISAGDVMLYQDDCLVLFYESHDTSHRYTPIGRLADIGGLAEAVGSSAVTVVLSE